MINEAQVFLSGYVATDPSYKLLPGGAAVAQLRVAYTPRWLNRETGEWSESPTSFLTVICWRKLADNVRMCLRKGEPVLVRGRLQVRRYEDKDGAPRIAVELDASSVGHDLARGVALFQRLPRDQADASARPAAETRAGSTAAGVTNGEAGPGADEAIMAGVGADEAAAIAAGSAEVPAGSGAAGPAAVGPARPAGPDADSPAGSGADSPAGSGAAGPARPAGPGADSPAGPGAEEDGAAGPGAAADGGRADGQAQPAGTSRKRRGATGAGRSSGHAAGSAPSGTADSSALDDDVVAALTADGSNQPEAEKAPVPV
ncbi:MAG: single-stranded DNA-binding protein [Nocardiopsaceae bacterium]|jgi:single-strand DNA-binding protein|nr:single-stranded DNA-binding protein [Nocardiopsaceae bacterium]